MKGEQPTTTRPPGWNNQRHFDNQDHWKKCKGELTEVVAIAANGLSGTRRGNNEYNENHWQSKTTHQLFPLRPPIALTEVQSKPTLLVKSLKMSLTSLSPKRPWPWRDSILLLVELSLAGCTEFQHWTCPTLHWALPWGMATATAAEKKAAMAKKLACIVKIGVIAIECTFRKLKMDLNWRIVAGESRLKYLWRLVKEL